jgi:hypothetical protein
MASSLVDISSATEADIPAIAAIFPQAIQPDIIGPFMFRDLNDQMLPVIPISGEFKHHLSSPNAKVFKASLTGTAEIVGYATVTFKDGKETSPSGPGSRLSPGMNKKFCRMHFGAMAERYAKRMSGKGKHVGTKLSC